MSRTLIFVGMFWLATLVMAAGAELRPPPQVTAGKGFSIENSGSGEATFYLVGPSHSAKRAVQLGQPIEVAEGEVRSAGRYLAIACSSEGCVSSSFFVDAADPANLSFLVHPSRVPVSAKGAISAVAFVFDRFHNPVLQPVTIDLRVGTKNAPGSSQSFSSQSLKTKTGVAWIRLDSSRQGGPAQITASIGDLSEGRIVQQVASDACNLRIKTSRGQPGVLVETDPIRDCSGNPVPDGTVVTFTQLDAHGKTTVDVPIKRGVAKVEMPASGSATISVASGVVIGNELHVGGAQ